MQGRGVGPCMRSWGFTGGHLGFERGCPDFCCGVGQGAKGVGQALGLRPEVRWGVSAQNLRDRVPWS